MPLVLSCSTAAYSSCAPLTWKSKAIVQGKRVSSAAKPSTRSNSGVGVTAICFNANPIEDPIFKEALKEPVAFMGGMFAGLLRLDLYDDPLKEWLTRTVESSGITEEEINFKDAKPEEIPQQIDIE